MVGVISDTHGRLVRPQAVAALDGVRATSFMPATSAAPEVLDALSRIAPVTAVRGNNDRERLGERAAGERPWSRLGESSALRAARHATSSTSIRAPPASPR